MRVNCFECSAFSGTGNRGPLDEMLASKSIYPLSRRFAALYNVFPRSSRKVFINREAVWRVHMILAVKSERVRGEGRIFGRGHSHPFSKFNISHVFLFLWSASRCYITELHLFRRILADFIQLSLFYCLLCTRDGLRCSCSSSARGAYS